MERTSSNILIDMLPDTVMVNGAEYRIRSDFRTGIRFEEMVRGKGTDEEKIRGILRLYYPVIPEDIEGAIEAALCFYKCGDKRERKNKAASQRRGKILYSFTQDAPYIFAAFLQQYGINLNRISADELHWWEFTALFEALGDNTLIREIMYYRNASLSGLSGKERQRILKMKEYYKLTDDETIDAKTALAKRNAEMRAYLKKRIEETKMRK